MTSVLVVDDGPADRELLATVLRHAGYRMLEAATGEQGLELARANRPDLIIADILMPTMDGYELVRELRDTPATAQIPVVFYTATYLIEEVRRLAGACGVSHVIAKPCESEDIIRVVGEALSALVEPPASLPSDDFHREHLRMLNAKLLQTVEELRDTVILAGTLRRYAGLQADDGRPAGVAEPGSSEWLLLSPRELDVMTMLAQGATDAEIGERLSIASSTVQSHVKHILRKLGVRNRTAAVVRYLSR